MKNISAKLFQVQQMLQPITKEKTNPFYGSGYFSVDDVISVLSPILDKVGLVVLQPFTSVDGKAAIQTVIIDPVSGEQVSMPPAPIPQDLDAQKMGAALTYLRRYGLVSMFLIQGEDDDDGNRAAGKSLEEVNQTLPKVHADDTTYADGRKKCPKCGKSHVGKFPKCLTCWKAEQPK